MNLSKEDRAWLEREAAAAEPYAEDAPELRTLDGPLDNARWSATMARKFLAQDDAEKAKKANTDTDLQNKITAD